MSLQPEDLIDWAFGIILAAGVLALGVAVIVGLFRDMP